MKRSSIWNQRFWKQQKIKLSNTKKEEKERRRVRRKKKECKFTHSRPANQKKKGRKKTPFIQSAIAIQTVNASDKLCVYDGADCFVSNNKNAGLVKCSLGIRVCMYISVSHPRVFGFSTEADGNILRIRTVLRFTSYRTSIYHPPSAIIWTKIFNIKKEVHIVVRPPVDVVVVRLPCRQHIEQYGGIFSSLFGPIELNGRWGESG